MNIKLLLTRLLFCGAAALAGIGAAPAAQAQVAAPGQPAAMAAVADTAQERCESLAGGRWSELRDAETWIDTATHHAAAADMPAFCQLYGYVNPQVFFGMLMPEKNWNGKYLVRGCGGSCGFDTSGPITVAACGKHVRDGYACLITNMGHTSTQIDNNWVANNLQGQVDFGYRATHVTTVVGKKILAAYYARDADRSYFYACSTGGRQAMIEAQRFPEDFDGIVAVAPASMGPFGARRAESAAPNPNRDSHGQVILPDLKVPLVYKAVLAKCDMKDGARDGLIDPRDCDFDPGTLVCKAGQNPDQCLTAAQVDVVRKFYKKGAQFGSELNWINNWTAPPRPALEFAQRRGDPDVIETLDNPANPDLRAFKARGGKLILTHGSTDLVVPGGPTLDYYELATRTMGGLAETQDFFRFFVIPGMDHCSGGDGAWGVDYVTALNDWVEHGKAPDKLVGIHPKVGVALDYFGLDSRLLKPQQIAFSRPYFPHPLRAYYSGNGDVNDEKNWVAALKQPVSSPHAAAGGSAATAAEPVLAQQWSTLVALLEDTYARGVALPPKNVSDRIGKALRRAIYTSGAADGTVATALRTVSENNPSAISQVAIRSVQAEFPVR